MRVLSRWNGGAIAHAREAGRVYIPPLVSQSIRQGLMCPAPFMVILAVSEQEEQAVVTGTLIWWWSTGMVLGVATSSLVLQNALLPNLGRLVSGPDREDVRFSTRSLGGGGPRY
ncbi:hypothetical protein PZA11_000091 [Diplocarpon coronariae]